MNRSRQPRKAVNQFQSSIFCFRTKESNYIRENSNFSFTKTTLIIEAVQHVLSVLFFGFNSHTSYLKEYLMNKNKKIPPMFLANNPGFNIINKDGDNYNMKMIFTDDLVRIGIQDTPNTNSAEKEWKFMNCQKSDQEDRELINSIYEMMLTIWEDLSSSLRSKVSSSELYKKVNTIDEVDFANYGQMLIQLGFWLEVDMFELIIKKKVDLLLKSTDLSSLLFRLHAKDDDTYKIVEGMYQEGKGMSAFEYEGYIGVTKVQMTNLRILKTDGITNVIRGEIRSSFTRDLESMINRIRSKSVSRSTVSDIMFK